MLEIIEFSRPDELGEGLLRERAEHAKVARSRQFMAHKDGKETGYLSFDDRSDIKTGVLYDLIVLPQYRRQGVGRGLVGFAEDLARSIGCHRIRLSATAFDRSVSQSWLESWYQKQGFQFAHDGSQEYEKYLA